VTLSNPLLKPAQFYLKKYLSFHKNKKNAIIRAFYKYFREIYSFIKNFSSSLCAFPAAVLLVSIGLVSPTSGI
jgi:hypothetical protein